MRYEYRYERFILDYSYELQPLLDEMAAAAWRVHTFLKGDSEPFSHHYDILFERELG